DADVPEAGAPVERRADHGVGEARLRGGRPAEVAVRRRLGLLELSRGDDLALAQLPAALVLAACIRERRLGLGKLGLGLVAVELDEDRAALDLLALGEVNRGDDVRHLGCDLDGLVRPRRADGLDLDAERLDDGLRRHDGRAPRRGARWAELCLRLRACRAGERRNDDESGSPSTAPARCQDRYRVPQQRLETASLPLTLVGLEGASYSTTSTPMDARAFTETSARDARASRSRGSDGGAQIRRELDPAASDGREHGLQRRDRAVLVDPAGRALLHADGQHDRRERLRVRAGLQRML